MDTIKKVKVRLVGEDGNAWAIMGRVGEAMRRAGHDREYIDKFVEEAMSGDYDHLLRVTLKYADDVGSYDEDDDE